MKSVLRKRRPPLRRKKLPRGKLLLLLPVTGALTLPVELLPLAVRLASLRDPTEEAVMEIECLEAMGHRGCARKMAKEVVRRGTIADDEMTEVSEDMTTEDHEVAMTMTETAIEAMEEVIDVVEEADNVLAMEVVDFAEGVMVLVVLAEMAPTLEVAVSVLQDMVVMIDVKEVAVVVVIVFHETTDLPSVTMAISVEVVVGVTLIVNTAIVLSLMVMIRILQQR